MDMKELPNNPAQALSEIFSLYQEIINDMNNVIMVIYNGLDQKGDSSLARGMIYDAKMVWLSKLAMIDILIDGIKNQINVVKDNKQIH